MKKLIIFVVTLFATTIVQAQSESNSGPVLTFEQTSVDFGELVQGDTISHVFKFKNTGTEPLMLSEVITTCGCTAPVWTRAAIAPGKSGEILIKYNSTGKMGIQNKIITVISNANNASQQSPARLSIRVNVLPPKK